jgi:hypothetical protein
VQIDEDGNSAWFDSAPGHHLNQNLTLTPTSLNQAMFPFGFHFVSAARMQTRSQAAVKRSVHRKANPKAAELSVVVARWNLMTVDRR